MKIVWQLLLLFVTTRATVAQVTDYTLDQDPVFKTVLTRRLTYPNQASWSSMYARIFVGFSVDERGRVKQISVLNHMSRGTRFGFEPAVITALKKLPSLNLRYAGNYLLPVAFIYVDYRHKDKPYVPKDTLYQQYVTDRIVLNEIKVFGNSVNSRERIRAAARNEGY